MRKVVLNLGEHLRTSLMVDEQLGLLIRGLKGNQLFTLYSRTEPKEGVAFEAIAQYASDRLGNIDVSTDASLCGSYTGVDAMGFINAAKSSPKHTWFQWQDVDRPAITRLQIYDYLTDNVNDLRHAISNKSAVVNELASISLARFYMKKGTRHIKLNLSEHGVLGNLFIPPGQGPFPGVINLTGGYPTNLYHKSSLLASHGYAVLELKYWGFPGLPKPVDDMSCPMLLDLSYFKKAVEFMTKYPDIDGEKGVAVRTNCATVPIGLLMAAHLDGIRGVCSINGPHFVLYGEYTYQGITFSPAVRYDKDYVKKVMLSGKVISVRRDIHDLVQDAHAHPDPSSIIPFEESKHVSYLFVSSLENLYCDAGGYADEVEDRLRQARHPDYKVVRCPGAGHLLEPSYHPCNSTVDHQGTIRLYGGSNPAHCKAQHDVWEETLNFLRCIFKSQGNDSKL